MAPARKATGAWWTIEALAHMRSRSDGFWPRLAHCTARHPRYNLRHNNVRMTHAMQPLNRFIPIGFCAHMRLQNISDKGAVAERFKSILGL